MDSLNNVFDSLNRFLSAFDLENPIWAATASLVVALLAYGLYRIWGRLVRKIGSKLEASASSTRGEKTLLGTVHRRPQQTGGEECGLATRTTAFHRKTGPALPPGRWVSE